MNLLSSMLHWSIISTIHVLLVLVLISPLAVVEKELDDRISEKKARASGRNEKRTHNISIILLWMLLRDWMWHLVLQMLFVVCAGCFFVHIPLSSS